MPAAVGWLVIDTADPAALAPLWCALLDVAVGETLGGGDYVAPKPSADGLTVGFQRVPESKTVKNRLQFDLDVDDLDAATAEVEALGGRWLEPGTTRELEGFAWRCMADRDGNEFDLDVLADTGD